MGRVEVDPLGSDMVSEVADNGEDDERESDGGPDRYSSRVERPEAATEAIAL